MRQIARIEKGTLDPLTDQAEVERNRRGKHNYVEYLKSIGELEDDMRAYP